MRLPYLLFFYVLLGEGTRENYTVTASVVYFFNNILLPVNLFNLLLLSFVSLLEDIREKKTIKKRIRKCLKKC